MKEEHLKEQIHKHRKEAHNHRKNNNLEAVIKCYEEANAILTNIPSEYVDSEIKKSRADYQKQMAMFHALLGSENRE